MYNALVFNEPATEDSVSCFEEKINFKLPSEYVSFLRKSNGAEGTIGSSYLILWKLEEILELNIAYNADLFVPGLLIFGSNGSDTAYCFDTRSDEASIVEVPFIGMNLDCVKHCSESFCGFLHYLSDKS